PMQSIVAEEEDGERLPLRCGRIVRQGGDTGKPEQRERQGGQTDSEPHDADSFALRMGREQRPTRTRPGGVPTRHGRTVDTPLLGVTMRILESRGGLATHVGW